MLTPLAPGITADPSANFGLFALQNAVNNYCGGLFTIATTTANAVTFSWANGIPYSVFRFTAGANGGFTITLPSTSTILGSLEPILNDGSFGIPVAIMNDNVGQTGTLTAGDASTTLTGTMTVATNTTRFFVLVVTGATTITVYNIGTQNL